MAVERRGWEEMLAPLSGVIAVVLWVVGNTVVESGNPPSDPVGESTRAYFVDESGTILSGGLLFMLGSVFFFWFLGSLRSVLAAAEGGLRRLTSIAYAGGVATGVCLLLLMAPRVEATITDEEDLSAPAAQALSHMSDVFFAGAQFAGVVLVAATGLAILSTRALPRWFGWASLVLALWLLIFPIGWAALIIGLPLWVLIAAILLWRQGVPVTDEPVTTRLAA